MKNLLLIIALLLTACSEVEYEYCDWQCHRERANAEWKKEHGEFQPNLTPEQEQYIVEWLAEHYPNGTKP